MTDGLPQAQDPSASPNSALASDARAALDLWTVLRVVATPARCAGSHSERLATRHLRGSIRVLFVVEIFHGDSFARCSGGSRL